MDKTQALVEVLNYVMDDLYVTSSTQKKVIAYKAKFFSYEKFMNYFFTLQLGDCRSASKKDWQLLIFYLYNVILCVIDDELYLDNKISISKKVIQHNNNTSEFSAVQVDSSVVTTTRKNSNKSQSDDKIQRKTKSRNKECMSSSKNEEIHPNINEQSDINTSVTSETGVVGDNGSGNPKGDFISKISEKIDKFKANLTSKARESLDFSLLDSISFPM